MSFYRNIVWFGKGMREYTKSGFEKASKNQNFIPNDLDVDCKGRNFLITGANSGIGKQTALEIAKRGGTVHMVCRNQVTSQEAMSEIKEISDNQNIHLHILDMSDSKAVLKFANNFNQPLNVLINNAGCMVHEHKLTEDGYETNFATNTLGTHILTDTLVGKLENAPRVVIVSSGGALTSKLDVEDFNFENMKPFDGTMAYSQNKRQQIVMAEEYAKKYPDTFFATMHPGWADTPAVRSAMPGFYDKMKDRLRTIEQGADTVVWLAMSEGAVKNESGLFFQDRQPVDTHLPLAWTRASTDDRAKLMCRLDDFKNLLCS